MTSEHRAIRICDDCAAIRILGGQTLQLLPTNFEKAMRGCVAVLAR